MKFSITKNFKKWIIATLIVIVAGMFVLGFAGLNKPVDYRVNYQVKIDVNENISASVETAKDVRDAIQREKQLKGWVRAKKNALVDSVNPQWKDLWEEIV